MIAKISCNTLVSHGLGSTPVCLQLAIGAEEHFEGVIDLVKMKAIYWNEDDLGLTFKEEDIPEDQVARALEYREKLIEAAAESSDELTEKYLEGGELTNQEIKQGIRQRTIANDIVPALCGSAFKNKGVQTMLDAVIEYLPAPDEVKAIKGFLGDTVEKSERHAEDDQPFAALAFKIATDPFVGALTFFRVYSGVLQSGDSVWNPIKGKKERIGRMVQMHYGGERVLMAPCCDCKHGRDVPQPGASGEGQSPHESQGRFGVGEVVGNHRNRIANA